MKKMKQKKGFTLIEVIVVIAILAILAAIAIPSITGYVEKAKETHDLNVASQYMRAAAIVMTDPSKGFYKYSYEWYAFKWGYTTDGKGNMNAHMGYAVVENGLPVEIHDHGRDSFIQNEVAVLMGWADKNGKLAFVPRPQSKVVERTGIAGNSFIFYFNIETGEILVDKGSEKWITELGVDAELVP